jgi:Domain of unknown function (DUF6894)
MENIIRPSLALIARYFFHVTKGDVVVEDEEQEFELVEAARGHAFAVSRELSRDGLPNACVGRYIPVMDGKGVLVFLVPLVTDPFERST